MKLRWINYVLMAVLLTGCAAVTPPAASPTVPPARPTTPLEEPVMSDATPTPDPQKPTPGKPVKPDDAAQTYSAQPGDDKLMIGPVFLDGAHVMVLESFPLQIMLSLEGGLPTPCHKLRAAIGEPDKNRRIEVRVYSVTDPNMMCTQVIAPLEAGLPIPTAGLAAGKYSVVVNGMDAGSFELP